MTTCIFLGPSLPIADALLLYPQCRFLPPVQHGSIYAAMQNWPLKAIGVIDGYFQHSPSVWHKEILWALDQGVYVAGAASMGALRAAELAAFGMVGIGEVFKGYEQGALPPFRGLTDDDEVAMVHGPAESGFVAVSEAMVNVRHTLDAACAAGVIDLRAAQVVINEAKRLHFSDRKYTRILEQAEKRGIPGDVLIRLSDWLAIGRVDQKRKDAIELIEHLSQLDTTSLPGQNKGFYFETTEIFHDALLSQPLASYPDDTVIEWERNVLDELRLNESAYRSVKRMAIVKCILKQQPLSQLVIQHESTDNCNDRQMQRAVDNFLRMNALVDRAKIDQWLAENDMKLGELEAVILDEARFAENLMLPDVAPLSTEMMNQLKLTGDYSPLAVRAREKSDFLASEQRHTPEPEHLINWYFKTLCGHAVPMDTCAYAQQLGLSGEASLLRLLMREYHFLTQMQVDRTP